MTLTELQQHVEKQVENMLCYRLDAAPYISGAVARTMNCLCHSTNKYAVMYADDSRENVPHT